MPGDDLSALRADHVFDGGDLDCGSGLALLIRQHMMDVPPRGILEIRSRERTVRDDLPPWCRMTGHEYLGAVDGTGAGYVHYFVRKGTGAQAEQDDARLAADLEAAKRYEWRVRARSTGPMRSKVYFRNFTVEVGQPASFEERDEHASAVEYLLAALGGAGDDGDPSFSSITVRCFASTLDDEAAVRASWDRAVLRSPLAATLRKACDFHLKFSVV